MGFFNYLFKPKVQPEELYIVTITDESVIVEHPKQERESIKWKDIHTILSVNTSQGPLIPDIWLSLICDTGRCMIPQGSKGFEDIYEIVSKYDRFDFENFIKSMTNTDNAEFLLWTNKI